MKSDLYEIDSAGVEMKACGGNLQSGVESCVEYAQLVRCEPGKPLHPDR